MLIEIPVSTQITIKHEKARYTNSHIKEDAQNSDILDFAKAVNSLQYGSPADMYLKTAKTQIKDV